MKRARVDGEPLVLPVPEPETPGTDNRPDWPPRPGWSWPPGAQSPRHAARDAGQPPNVGPVMWTLRAVSTPRGQGAGAGFVACQPPTPSAVLALKMLVNKWL